MLFGFGCGIFEVGQPWLWRLQCQRDDGASSGLRLSARKEAVVRCHAVSTAASDSRTMSLWQRSDGAAFGPRLCAWVALELVELWCVWFVSKDWFVIFFGATYFVGAISARILCFKFNVKVPPLAWVHTSWVYTMTVMFWWISQIPRLVESVFIRTYHPIRRWNPSARGFCALKQ